MKEIRDCVFCGNMISATGKSKRFGSAYMSREEMQNYDDLNIKIMKIQKYLLFAMTVGRKQPSFLKGLTKLEC